MFPNHTLQLLNLCKMLPNSSKNLSHSHASIPVIPRVKELADGRFAILGLGGQFLGGGAGGEGAVEVEAEEEDPFVEEMCHGYLCVALQTRMNPPVQWLVQPTMPNLSQLLL